jgi:methylenetetrahydrofolate--tRNA-(uracil-5-)-methyltransferase
MLGALCHYLVASDPARFQPMNANFGLVEPLDPQVRDKEKRKAQLVERALRDIETFAASIGVPVAV